MNIFTVSLFGHREIVIVWVERNKGGAYAATEYAKKLGKYVVNLYEMKGV